jgi:hypothetical protein
MSELHDNSFAGDSLDANSEVSPVKTFTHRQWEALSEDARNELFSKHTIHRMGEPVDQMMPDVKSWDDTRALGRWFNLDIPYCVHGSASLSCEAYDVPTDRLLV